MNRMRIAFITALLLGTATVLAYAQEPQDEPKPPKQEEPRAPRQEEPRSAKPEKQEAPKPPNEQSRHEEKGQQGHARPAGKSAHIPDAKFKANFGRQHRFAVKHVINTTTVVVGQTQFVYGGYTFIFLDPWPSVWLFTDDCYIDYVDGDYFLFDAVHPGIQVALFVQF